MSNDRPPRTPEEQEIDRLESELARVKAERDEWRDNGCVRRMLFETIADRDRLSSALERANGRVETLTVERDGAVKRALMVLNAKDDWSHRARVAEGQVETLRGALDDCVELAAEGWGYASEYFQTKWGSAERIEAARAALTATKPDDS